MGRENSLFDYKFTSSEQEVNYSWTPRRKIVSRLVLTSTGKLHRFVQSKQRQWILANTYQKMSVTTTPYVEFMRFVGLVAKTHLLVHVYKDSSQSQIENGMFREEQTGVSMRFQPIAERKIHL